MKLTTRASEAPTAWHISWRIAALCMAVVIGIAASALLNIPFMANFLWLILGLVLLIPGLVRPQPGLPNLILCFVIAGLMIGMWRGSNEQLAMQRYDTFRDQTVTVQAKVNEDVGHGDRGDTRMQLADVRVNNIPLHGKVWASTTTPKRLKRNDTVYLYGKLSQGFGNIPASMSNAQLIRVNHTNKDDLALQVRDWFAAGIRRAVPEPQASLGSGFLVGQHSSLPGNLDDELRAVGLTHAVVASGSNLTIMVGVARRIFMRFSKYTATLAGGLMTAGFVLVAGFSPSMTRAGLVTGLSLAAWYYGRRIHPLVLLPIAAGITTIANPSYLWGDIGWYLSFGAFAGVLVLAPLMQSYFWGKDYKPNLIMEIFIGTTAAQIATMPVILFSFGTYSSYALLANLLVLPLVPLAMLLTFIAGIAGIAVPAAAMIIGWPASMVMRYMTTVISWVANLPGATGDIAYGQVALIASYGFMAVACLYMWRKTQHSFRQGSNILIGERA